MTSTPNPNGLLGDRHTRVVIPMADQAMWRRTGHAIPAAEQFTCLHGDKRPCDYPVCRCQHQAAEAATEVGADDNRPGQGADVLIWAFVGALVLAALGFGVALLLPMAAR